MAIKTLLLVPVTLCFLLVLAVAAQDDDNDREYRIIANGTVTCIGNRSADLEYIQLNVRLDDTDTGRYNLRVSQPVGYGYTDSTGKFTIRIRFYDLSLRRHDVFYWIFPQFLNMEVDHVPENVKCPSDLEVEAYAKINIAQYTSNGSYFVGVHIFPNGTRTYFEEYIK